MLQKATQWAALLASRRASAMGVQQQGARLSPLVLHSGSKAQGYATAASSVAPGDGASPPVHSTPAPQIKTTRLTNLGNVGGGIAENEQRGIGWDGGNAAAGGRERESIPC